MWWLGHNTVPLVPLVDPPSRWTLPCTTHMWSVVMPGSSVCQEDVLACLSAALLPGMVPPCTSTTRVSSKTAAAPQHPGDARLLLALLLVPASSPRAEADVPVQPLQQRQQLLASCRLPSLRTREAVVGAAARAGSAAGRARRPAAAAVVAADARGRVQEVEASGALWAAKR